MPVGLSSNRSFFFYFIIATSLLVSILVVTLAGVYAVSFRGYYTEEIRQDSLATVEAVLVLVRDYLYDSEQELTAALALASGEYEDNDAELMRYFAYAALSDPAVLYYQAIGRNGIVELMYPRREELIGTDASQQSYFREGIVADGFRWRGAILSSQANEPVITGTLPYRDGLFVVQTSLAPMLARVSEISAVSRGEIGVTDAKGIYLLHSDTELVRQRVITPFVDALGERTAGLETVGDSRYFLVSIPIEEIDGHVILYQDYRLMLSDLYRIFYRLSGIAVLFLIAAFILAWFSGRLFLRPLASAEKGIKRIAAGDYSVRFGELPFSELNVLTTSINHMASRIEQRQRELEAARRTAEEANLAKDRFLANMSHELRTPLNGIRGMASLLSADLADPDAEQKLELINTSVEVISQVVGDILDYALIEHQELQLHETRFRLFDTVRDLVELVRFQGEAKGIAVNLDFQLSEELSVVADKVRLSQILMNLLTNAVKYTREGHVDVEVRELDGSPGRRTVEFAVRDTGIGIPAADMQRVFERFTQLDDSTTKSGRGIGLGLAISRELVKMMGGTIAVDSREGRGSRFSVVLPLDEAPDRSEAAPPASAADFDPGRYTLLVAEDEAINRMYLTGHLKRAGFRVLEAVNGREACELAFRERPDCILLDISMPVMDGWAAAAEIRSNPALGETAILALTAHARAEVRDRSLEVGMNGFVSKPIDEATLDAAIAEVLTARSDAEV